MEHTFKSIRQFVLGPVLLAASVSPFAAAKNHRGVTLQNAMVELPGGEQRRELVAAGALATAMPSIKSHEMKSFLLETTTLLLPLEWKAEAESISSSIETEALRHGFDPIFLMAVIKHESRFDPDSIGLYGEIGLMQIKPDTAQWIAKRNGIKNFDLWKPADNIRIGALLFAYLRKGFESDAALYLAAYNMGASNVRGFLERGIRPAIYARNVLREYNVFQMRLGLTAAERQEPTLETLLISKTPEARGSLSLKRVDFSERLPAGIPPAAMIDRRRSLFRDRSLRSGSPEPMSQDKKLEPSLPKTA